MASGNKIADETEQPKTRPAIHGRKRRYGRRKGAKSTTNTSTTSPRTIAVRKNRAEALNLRERGYTYEQISRHMKRPMMTVHRWVSDAIDEIVQEPAARVLKLELQRLDAL